MNVSRAVVGAVPAQKAKSSARSVQCAVWLDRARMSRVASVGAWAALIGTGLWLYAPILRKLASDWWTDPDYSHGLLCAPLAIGLIAASRGRLAAIPRAPHAAGLAGAAASMAVLGAGLLGAELFLTRVSLLLFVGSGVVYLFGWRHLRALAFPLALLFLSIPIPAILVTRITLPLQFAASAMAETTLRAMSIPVLREGNVLALPNATLQVAEACSGIRSLVSLVVLALVVARFGERRASARIAIVLCAAPIAVLVNGLRVTATGVATYRYGSVAAEGIAHELMGFAAFGMALVLLLACARIVALLRPRRRVMVAA